MMTQNIDPDWAWSPFVPDANTPWDLQAAAHLFRRAGFCATRAELESAIAEPPAKVVDRLVNGPEPEQYRQQAESLAQSALATGSMQQLGAWWSWRMLTTPAPLQEKMTLFWHGHFATSASKVTDARLMLAQNDLFRRCACGDFSQLLLDVSRDPAMLIYLDAATSRKAHPNENYAREIMELFCLGEGHYSEHDIRELARCFTGWEIRRDRFRFNPYQHDAGVKQILGQQGVFGGEDGVRIVLEQPSAPQFIVSRLLRYFAFDEPVAPASLTEPLAAQLRASDMQVRPVLQQLLSSQLFFSRHCRARRVRSPVELAVGLLRSLESSTNMLQLAEQLQTLGQGLFYPPSVKGWDGGRTWINSSSLLGRSNLVRQLLENEKTRFSRQPLSDYLKSLSLRSGEQIVRHLETLLFAVPVPTSAREQVSQLIDGPGDAARNLVTGLQTLCTLPEFQLC